VGIAALYGPGEGGELNLVDSPITSSFLSPGNTPSGGASLVSTTGDYLRFAQMLLNGGKLCDTQLLSRKTVELMSMNHVPEELLPIQTSSPWPGVGYGLGMFVWLDVAQPGTLGSEGTVHFGGAGNTWFWVDPREELVGLIMAQRLALEVPIRKLFQNLMYQAIID